MTTLLNSPLPLEPGHECRAELNHTASVSSAEGSGCSKRLVPPYEPRNTFLDLHRRLVSDDVLKPLSIGVGPYHITRLHIKKDLFCFSATCRLDCLNKARKLNGLVVADIVQAVRNTPAGNHFLNSQNAFHDIVDIGEVPLHSAMVEYFDRLTFQDRFGEQPRRHISPAGNPVNSKKSQSSDRQPIKLS